MSLTGIIMTISMFLYAPSLSARVSAKEFREKTQEHIDRVTVLGVAVQEEFPEHFEQLSRDLVVEYLSQYHDAPKLWTLSQLRKHHYSLLEGLDIRLARYFGINKVLNNLTQKQQKDFDETIDELNRIETELKREFLNKHTLSESQRQALFLLEKAVDLADTGMSRWTELGLPKEKALASIYLSQTKGSDSLLELVLWLEDNFETILRARSFVFAASCRPILQSVGE